MNSDDSGSVESDLKENQELTDTERERGEILTKRRPSPGSNASNLKVSPSHSLTNIIFILSFSTFITMPKENSVFLHFY